MKPYYMTPEEMALLDKVKDMADYHGLSKFFNRSELLIRNAVYKLTHGRRKYIYTSYNNRQFYEQKLRFSKQPFNGILSK